MSLYRLFKTIFLILICIYIFPPIARRTAYEWQRYSEPTTLVGVIQVQDELDTPETICKQLHDFFTNTDIAAIMITIDSPGTTAGTGSFIYQEIKSLKASHPKPILSLVHNCCTSGAYLIACATDYIIAPPMAIIGSIGVRLTPIFQLQKLLEKHMIQTISLQAGTCKNSSDPFATFTAEQQNMLQDVLDDSYLQFITLVANERNLAVTEATTWANGKIFTGQQALNLGLIDAIGAQTTALLFLKNNGLIEGEVQFLHDDNSAFWTTLFRKLKLPTLSNILPSLNLSIS